MGRVATPGVKYPARTGAKFASPSEYVVVNCPSCHIQYAIPKSLDDSAKRYPGDDENGWKLSCPLGHTWWYVGRSIETKLSEERDALSRERARHDQTRAHLHGTKIAKIRFRNERDRLKARAAAGVCPCCNRTFQQLARHMAKNHPEFVDG